MEIKLITFHRHEDIQIEASLLKVFKTKSYNKYNNQVKRTPVFLSFAIIWTDDGLQYSNHLTASSSLQNVDFSTLRQDKWKQTIEIKEKKKYSNIMKQIKVDEILQLFSFPFLQV